MRMLDAGENVPVLAAIHGDAVAKPQLTADVPVAEARHPVEIDALVALGVPDYFPGSACGDRAVAELLHLQPPLLADQRLDDRVAPIAVAHVVRVGLLLDEMTAFLQVRDHELARLDPG